MTGRLLEDQGAVWVVAAVSFLLFLVGNLPWQLDDYDQAKQAYTSFEMIKEGRWFRSEEHTSELQSLRHLVCRLLLEKKKKQKITDRTKKSSHALVSYAGTTTSSRHA